MKSKIFKNLDEQVEIMRSKGLIINDEESTKEILLRENYFFINGYRHMFTAGDKDKFIPGTTFEEMYATFLFDRYIRNIMFKYILINKDAPYYEEITRKKRLQNIIEI